jgi:hypothetical protein
MKNKYFGQFQEAKAIEGSSQGSNATPTISIEAVKDTEAKEPTKSLKQRSKEEI